MKEFDWTYDIAQKIHKSDLSYLYLLAGVHLQIYSMLSGKYYYLLNFDKGYMVAEVDLRLSIPNDGLIFNKIVLLSHRYAIITTEVSFVKN